MSAQQQLLRDELVAWREASANGHFARRETPDARRWWRSIYWRTYEQMKARIEAVGLRPRDVDESEAFLDAERALACDLLAAMAEDELKASAPKKRPSSTRSPKKGRRP